MADTGLIRKRLVGEIDRERRAAAERRQRAKSAGKDYDAFLDGIAIPVFRQFATVLRAEGFLFEVQTPQGGVRLVPDRQRDDGIGIALDATSDPPQVTVSSTHTWGSRIARTERALKDRAPIDSITEDDVLERLFEEIRPWLG